MSKILILGAGASFGHGLKNKTKPPLASRFFECDSFDKVREKYNPVISYIDKISTEGLTKDIEELFSEIDGTWNLNLYDDIDQRLKLFGDHFFSMSPIDWMRSLITDIIYDSTRWLRIYTCPHHDKLVQNVLSSGDSVISFNYDLIIDKSLKSKRNWHESTGYGFINSRFREFPSSEISLYKLHGALNWFKSEKYSFDPYTKNNKSVPAIKSLSLEEAIEGHSIGSETSEAIFNYAPNSRIFDVINSAGISEDSIEYYMLKTNLGKMDIYEKGFLPFFVMPTPYKPFDQMNFAELHNIWKDARKSIFESEELISIGFSFRDQHFNQMLLEVAMERKEPLRVQIIDKDISVIDRVHKKFKDRNININHFNGYLEDYVC